MPVYRKPGGVYRKRAWDQRRRRSIFSLASSGFSDSGTIPVTIVLSGTDTLASVDAGTIPLTITMSGSDTLSSVDAGTIPLTIVLSGVEIFGPSAGASFRDLRDRSNQINPSP